MENEIFTVSIPSWAKGYADGDYTKIGAALPTRNGNFIGNAVLISVRQGEIKVDGNFNGTKNVDLYTVITDAGSLLEDLTLKELKDLFHPPVYLTDPNDCPASRAYKHKEKLEFCRKCTENINKELLDSLEETRKLLSLVTFLNRKLVNHPDKESIASINSVLSRARKVCEDAKNLQKTG